MSLMILVLIGSSLLATLWLLQRQQHAELRDTLGRTAQVVETLLEAQRQSLEHQAKLVGELPILTTVVESGDPGTIRDSAQTYHAQLAVPLLDVLDAEGNVLVSVQDVLADPPATAPPALVAAALKGETRSGLYWRVAHGWRWSPRPRLGSRMIRLACYRSDGIWMMPWRRTLPS